MRIFEEKGYFLDSSKQLVIDPMNGSCAERTALVTHAHADHVSLKQSAYLMSEATKQLVETRFHKISKVIPLMFGKQFSFDGLEISVHNSGHVLGSSQVLVNNDKRIVFTSDFKLQESLVTKPAEILKSDVLVIESTFGQPQYSFPEREKTYNEMAQWVKQSIAQKKFVVLAGYALGKAQELTAFCNAYCNEVPVVHESIFKNNQVYEQNGVKLGEYLQLGQNLKETNILIMPPSLLNGHVLQALEFSLKKKLASAMATGWQYRSHFDKVFPLSDHADFAQLLQYVKESKPKLVLTAHGFAKELAHAIQRKLKIPAREIDAHGQRALCEFD